MNAVNLTIDVDTAQRVSGVLQQPPDATACLLLAHGAGAGMHHPSMASLSDGLFKRGIATLRYQFPYMERGSRRPDPPPLCHATVRAAAAVVRKQLPDLRLFAGGRSFGGRMTSQTQAIEPLPGVSGLVFFAFPLHPSGEPGISRAAHLSKVAIPMLFLQGTRDALAELSLLEPLVEKLAGNSTLHVIQDGDHSFHVRASSGRNDAQARDEMLDATVRWIARH